MSTPPPSRIPWLLLLVVSFLAARYAASPLTGFVLDDWNYLNLGARCEGVADAASQGFTKDLNRPLSTMVMAVGFHVFGQSLLPYMLLLAAGHLVLLLLATALARRWTGGGPRLAFLYGLGFATLPLLTETFYFPMLAFVAATLGLPMVLASAYGITRYAEDGRPRWLALAWGPYLISLFSYEVGAFLPAAFAVLLIGRQPLRKTLLALAGYALCLGFYLLWRSTEAFGLLKSTTPEHMKAAGAGIAHVAANGRELLRWWIGDLGLLAWRQGWEAFLRIPLALRCGLLLLNLALCLLSVRALQRLPATPIPTPPNRLRLLLFAAVWFLVASLPALLSYVVSRLLILPALAVLLTLVLLIHRLPKRAGLLLGVPLLFLALLSTQGTNWSWRESAQAYRKVFQTLGTHHADWVDKKLLLYDSRRLRREKGDPDPVRAVAFHGNASLFRGSGLREMSWLLQPRQPRPTVRLDVEYGAEITETEVLLHRRFDPTSPVVQRVPLDQVYLLDLADALPQPAPAP